MTWTYTSAPATDTTDAVRLLIGQTSSGDTILLADEPILWALTVANTTYDAAAMAAEMLAARYLTVGAESETIGDTSVDWGDRASKLQARAQQLRALAIRVSVTPFLGGQSLADRNTREADTDLRQPAFRSGRFDNLSGFSTGSSTS